MGCDLCFQVKNMSFLAWFHKKLLNENSCHRTKVRRDFMKCWKLLSSVNFQWLWIHWSITCSYPIYTFLRKSKNSIPGRRSITCIWMRISPSPSRSCRRRRRNDPRERHFGHRWWRSRRGTRFLQSYETSSIFFRSNGTVSRIHVRALVHLMDVLLRISPLTSQVFVHGFFLATQHFGIVGHSL